MLTVLAMVAWGVTVEGLIFGTFTRTIQQAGRQMAGFAAADVRLGVLPVLVLGLALLTAPLMLPGVPGLILGGYGLVLCIEAPAWLLFTGQMQRLASLIAQEDPRGLQRQCLGLGLVALALAALLDLASRTQA